MAMQELSLNVLDIAQNSIKAEAALVSIIIIKSTAENTMSIEICDDGCGMDQETVEKVLDPFYTTRTTRAVGLGVPFFKMSAEQTGGSFSVESEPGCGTRLLAVYHTGHIDMMPLGDMASTMVSLVSVNPEIDFVYRYEVDGQGFTMDTREMKQILEGLPVNSPEVLAFIKEYILENTAHTDAPDIE